MKLIAVCPNCQEKFQTSLWAANRLDLQILKGNPIQQKCDWCNEKIWLKVSHIKAQPNWVWWIGISASVLILVYLFFYFSVNLLSANTTPVSSNWIGLLILSVPVGFGLKDLFDIYRFNRSTPEDN